MSARQTHLWRFPNVPRLVIGRSWSWVSSGVTWSQLVTLPVYFFWLSKMLLMQELCSGSRKCISKFRRALRKLCSKCRSTTKFRATFRSSSKFLAKNRSVTKFRTTFRTKFRRDAEISKADKTMAQRNFTHVRVKIQWQTKFRSFSPLFADFRRNLANFVLITFNQYCMSLK